MRRRHAIAALPLLTGLAGPAAAQGQRGQTVAWPEGIALLDGRPWQPVAGQGLVVVMWSTTCPFCKRHNVHVERLHRALAGRAASVLGVSRDRDADAVRRHLAQHGLSFPVTLDWRPLAAALGARNVIPLTITVDRQGRLLQAIPGEMFEEDVMELASFVA